MKCLSIVFSIFLLFGFHNTLFANSKTEVLDAFQELNQALYTITETRDYCNASLPAQILRNHEAYDEWELQYSFFLKEYDTNYAKWKSGFSPEVQKQFPVLEEVLRYKARQSVEAEYAEGTKDKCYNFKPALGRPRNNLELSFQDSVNLIRNNALNNFSDARGSVQTHAICAWQQAHALSVAEQRNQGKDEKTQKEALKNFRKQNTDDKDIQKQKISAYGDMISEIYMADLLEKESFSLYRLSVCEREQANIRSAKFKQALPTLVECQKSSANTFDLLSRCIFNALEGK